MLCLYFQFIVFYPCKLSDCIKGVFRAMKYPFGGISGYLQSLTKRAIL